jgi:hypothetical protein
LGVRSAIVRSASAAAAAVAAPTYRTCAMRMLATAVPIADVFATLGSHLAAMTIDWSFTTDSWRTARPPVAAVSASRRPKPASSLARRVRLANQVMAGGPEDGGERGWRPAALRQ